MFTGSRTKSPGEPLSPFDIASLAATSVLRFSRFAWSDSFHLRRDRLGKSYRIDRGGEYTIFRESVLSRKPQNRVVLVVGFRLRFIRSIAALHWLFQRVCILTTPFWSGFRGFRVKLWMVDKKTKNYLGIYDWATSRDAKAYADTLVVVLHPLSTANSVWYEIEAGQDFEAYLDARRVDAGSR